MKTRPLTAVAQQAVAQVLRPGDRAIDATVGNGHDTLFLATQVAPNGRVIGFDVQQVALDNTGRRLRDAGLAHLVELHHCGHQRMLAQVPVDWIGTVAAVMFNLGYLPGGDKSLITRAVHTLAGLDQAAQLLRPGGLMSLLVYRGHTGAADEAAAVATWIGGLGTGFDVTRRESPGPLLYLVSRGTGLSRRGAGGN